MTYPQLHLVGAFFWAALTFCGFLRLCLTGWWLKHRTMNWQNLDMISCLRNHHETARSHCAPGATTEQDNTKIHMVFILISLQWSLKIETNIIHPLNLISFLPSMPRIWMADGDFISSLSKDSSILAVILCPDLWSFTTGLDHLDHIISFLPGGCFSI